MKLRATVATNASAVQPRRSTSSIIKYAITIILDKTRCEGSKNVKFHHMRTISSIIVLKFLTIHDAGNGIVSQPNA